MKLNPNRFLKSLIPILFAFSINCGEITKINLLRYTTVASKKKPNFIINSDVEYTYCSIRSKLNPLKEGELIENATSILKENEGLIDLTITYQEPESNIITILMSIMSMAPQYKRCIILKATKVNFIN